MTVDTPTPFRPPGTSPGASSSWAHPPRGMTAVLPAASRSRPRSAHRAFRTAFARKLASRGRMRQYYVAYPTARHQRVHDSRLGANTGRVLAPSDELRVWAG